MKKKNWGGRGRGKKRKKKNLAEKPLGGGGKKKNQCYYPHWSRDLVSPICEIFLIVTKILTKLRLIVEKVHIIMLFIPSDIRDEIKEMPLKIYHIYIFNGICL